MTTATYMPIFSVISRIAWGYRITGPPQTAIRGTASAYPWWRAARSRGARRGKKVFPLEQYFPAGGYIAPITVYLRFATDDLSNSPDLQSEPERVAG